MSGRVGGVLVAVALLAAGCGESNTHSAAEVRRALAAHGIDAEIVSTEPPRAVRAKVSAATLRIALLLRYNAARLAGLAERKTAHRAVFGDSFSIVVASDPEDAKYVRYLFGRRGHAHRVDNLVVVDSTPAVDRVLADLR